MLAVVGWLAFAVRIAVLIGNGAFQFAEPIQVFTNGPGPVGHGRRAGHAGARGLHDVARAGLPVTAGIERLEGVWTIVPTPFRPDGALDADSLPTLTRFIADRGVDGMTILGVLGEARPARRRRAGPGHRRGARRGRRPAGLRRGEPCRDGPGGRLRPARRGGRGPLGDARPAGPGPAERRGGPSAHYRAVADAIGIPVVVQDHPASSGVTMTVDVLTTIAEASPSCRVIKLEDEPSPPKVGRLMAARADLRRPGRARRDHARRRAAARGGRDDDRLRVPGAARRDRRPVPGRRRGGRAGHVPPDHAAHPVREPAGPEPRHPQAHLPAARRDRRRNGCGRRRPRSTRARSPTSTRILAGARPGGPR